MQYRRHVPFGMACRAGALGTGRTVDESRAWLKRIAIPWVILNGLSFILAYVTPFFSDGKWSG